MTNQFLKFFLKAFFGLFLMSGCLLPQIAFCDVHFAQLTDPHLFDKNEEATNEFVLRWCISCINSNVQQGVHYNFVVVTGDIGIEKIAKKQTTNSSGILSGPTDKEITNAVETLAKYLSASQVKRWLFIPGNNDLSSNTVLGEDPATIIYYRKFMRTLAERLGNGMEIKDLTAREGDLSSGYDDEKATADGTNFVRFIGFDNASFKGNYLSSNAIAFASIQSNEIQMVEQRIPSESQSEYKGAFIFYHIPEIEDPYLVSPYTDAGTIAKIETGRGIYATKYPHSAWTVTTNVRDAWFHIVTNDRVHGLFAGHFHSSDRRVYKNFDWMSDGTIYAPTLGKLLVAPPIAIKKQEDKPEPARGYREVTIDGETGKVANTELIFFDPSPLAQKCTDKKEECADKQHEHSIKGHDLIVNFVLAPCVVLAILGAFVSGCCWAYKEFGLKVSARTLNAMIMGAVCLGAIIVGFATLGTLAECCDQNICRVVSVGALWALAALVVGGALGILFGAPRSANSPGKDGTVPAKTLLEDMADWLSKLIVGGSLFESRKILNLLDTAGQNFAATISCPASCLWSGVGSALLVYFGIVGFFSAYFLMRLYLARVIDDADGRSVVSDRTGLPQAKLDILENAPLNVESPKSDDFGNGFDPIAQDVAKEMGAIPLESLTNWRDIRLWAKAKLSRKEKDAALEAYQKAIEIVPNDAETRLGYAIALWLKESSKEVIQKNLEIAHDCLMKRSSLELRKSIFKALSYLYLYFPTPESFEKTLGYAKEYFGDPKALPSSGLWVNIACAYGQLHTWLENNDPNQVDPKDLMVNSKQEVPGANLDLRKWARDQALMAVRMAMPNWKETLQTLMGEGPKKSTQENVDNDLEAFKDDPDFRLAVGLPIGGH